MVIHNRIKQKGGGESLSLSLSLSVLTTNLPSIPATCNNPIGWHHAIESFHRPHSYLQKHLVLPRGFIFYSGTLRIGLTGPETSVTNYHYLLRNNPEERATQLIRARSLYPCHSVCMYWTVFSIIRYICTESIPYHSVHMYWRYSVSFGTYVLKVLPIIRYICTESTPYHSVHMYWTKVSV